MPFAVLWSQIFAIVATWLITGLNYLGIRKAGDFQLVFTWLKGVLIVAIAGICFASMAGHWGNFATSFLGAHGGFGGFMIALIAALWAYDGWNDLTMVAGEVRNPERSLPIALIAGLGIVGVLYMATNAAIQYILPASQIAASPRPAVTALAAITGPWGAGLVSDRHGGQHLCHIERHNYVRRARSLRRGARWAVLPAHGRYQSALRQPFNIARRAGAADHRVAARRRSFPATL